MKRTQAFDMKSYQRLLNISYEDYVANEEVHRSSQVAIGKYGDLLALVKKQKLRWFGYVSRFSDLAMAILQDTVTGKRRGRQKERWGDNMKELTDINIEWTLPAQLG